jgi:tetratricopeptide (TPR) repeat protein
LERAERAQLINEIGRSGGGVFTFAHALIPTTLVERMSGLRRRRLYRQVAETVALRRPDDFEALAHYFSEAADEERACAYYGRAGDRALAAFANHDAERHYHHALEFDPPDQEKAPLLAGFGEALARQSRLPEALAALDQTIALYHVLNDSDNLARWYARSARLSWMNGQTAQGLELCRQGLTAVGDNLQSAGAVILLHEAARAYFFNGLAEEAYPLVCQALAQAEQMGLGEIEAESLTTLGLMPQVAIAERMVLLTKAITLAENANLPDIAFRAYNNLANTYMTMGELEKAVTYYQRAAASAQRYGIVNHRIWHLNTKLSLLMLSGRFDEGETLLLELRELVAAHPDAGIVTQQFAINQLRWHRYFGEFESSRAPALSLLQKFQERGELQFVGDIGAFLGEIYLESGNLVEARQVLEQAVAVGENIPTRWPRTFMVIT